MVRSAALVLHRRRVDANPLALDQTLLGDELQHPAEDRLVDLTREPPARLRQPGVIGNLLPVLQPQKIAQRHRIRTAPGDAALAADPLEITDHVHAEVTARRYRRGTHLRRVIGLARRLDKPVKTARDQHFLKPLVKHMTRRAWYLRPGHHQIALTIALPPHRHASDSGQLLLPHTESTKPDFVNGLLSASSNVAPRKAPPVIR